MTEVITRTEIINASATAVWDTLTNPKLMEEWMAEPGMQLVVEKDSRVGSPILFRGFHHVKFANKGTILELQPYRIFRYNYLSSLSKLPDRAENYTVIQFELVPVSNGISLILTVTNFPTEIIYRHVEFYWRATMTIIKSKVEMQSVG